MGAEIGILRMPMGNLQSAWNAVYELGFDPVFLDADGDFDSVSHLIVPGDGNFRAVMQHLESSGATTAIREFAASGRPVLGICSGMQVLADKGLESGGTPGLGLVPGTVQIMTPEGNLRLPHIGWNSAEVRIDHPVFEGLKPNRDFYFVHGYAFVPDSPDHCLAETDYGGYFASIVGNGNVVGFQFHPEKSQINGLKLIENFLNWGGSC